MNSDSYFRISQKTATHPICQDYTQAGEKDSVRYVVVADGCSSAKDTDFGARLLVRSLVNELGRHESLRGTYEAAISVADSCRRTINLLPEALHATLLCAVERPESVEVGIYGDGYIVARKQADKSLLVIKHEFTSNAPFYLSYMLQPESYQKYEEKFCGDSDEFVITKSTLKPGQVVFESGSESRYHVNEGMQLRSYNFDRNEWDLVAILSDGLGSFYKSIEEGTSRIDKPVDIEHVIPKLFEFKGTAGTFLLRRSIRAFKDFDDLGWKNADDFSFGVVCND